MNYLEKRNTDRRVSAELRPPYVRLPYVTRGESEPAGDGDLTEFFRYLGILRQHWILLGLFGLLGILGGIAFSLSQTPVYRARTSLEVQGPARATMTDRGQTALSADDFYTHESLLKSHTLLIRVINKVEPNKGVAAGAEPKPVEESTPAEREDAISPWKMIVSVIISAMTSPSPRETALGMILESLKVKAARQGRLIEITSDSTDPALAARFVNTLTHEYIEQRLEDRWNSYQKTGEWLNRAHDDLKRKLEKSEEKLQEYARASGLLFLSEDTSVAEQKLNQLQEELSRAQAERITKQSRYELTVSSNPESLPEVLDNGPLAGYQVRLADLRRQLAELTSALTPAHPKVERVQAQINELESTLAKERSYVIKRIRNEYQSSLEREKLLASSYGNQAGIVSQQAEKAIQYNILKREVETNRQLYDATLQKGKEASIDSALRASDVRVVDPARRPDFPYRPNLLINLPVGCLSGLLLAVAFVLIREFRNRSVRVPGETPAYLNVPELGVIPASAANAGRSLVGKLRRLLPQRGTPATSCVELTTWHDKPSLLAESFRTVLASVVFSGQEPRSDQIVAVTSAFPAEGKTTVTSNLGIALAEIGQRVLLIDADMRKPRLHRIFDRSNSWGLSDLLQEKNPIDNYPSETLVRRTDIPGLSILTSGPGTVSIANLLYSERLPQLLNRLRRDFDTILIDSPPMLHIADARVLGRLADAAILVIRAGRTPQEAVSTAVQRFQEDGSRVLGTILNDWDPKSAKKSGYQYGYAYSHYYKGQR
jgi:succinoglycan biosynthesis transport protein ExoP